jgi:hypothetical protein
MHELTDQNTPPNSTNTGFIDRNFLPPQIRLWNTPELLTLGLIIGLVVLFIARLISGKMIPGEEKIEEISVLDLAEYNITHTPHTLVIRKNGQVIVSWDEGDASFVEQLLKPKHVIFIQNIRSNKVKVACEIENFELVDKINSILCDFRNDHVGAKQIKVNDERSIVVQFFVHGNWRVAIYERN